MLNDQVSDICSIEVCLQLLKKVGSLQGLNPELPGGRPLSYPLDHQYLDEGGRRLELTYQTFNGFCSSLSLSLTEATSIDLWSS